MTVRLLVQYGKYPKNSLLSTGSATEAELLRTGQADTSTSLGTAYTAPVPTERSGPAAVETSVVGDLLRADGRTLANLTVAGSVPFRLYRFGDSWPNLETSGAGWDNSFGWINQMCMLAGAPFREIINAGVDGNTTAMMRARIWADVLSKAPGYVTIQAGTVNDQAAGIPPSQAKIDVAAMCADAKAAGFRVILSTCPPNGNVTNTAFPERRRYVAEMNAWAHAYAAANGHLLADVHKYCTDPLTGNFYSGYSFDSTHLATLGGLPVGKGAYDDIGASLPVYSIFASPLDPTNLLGAIGIPFGDNAGALQTDSAALKAAAGGFVLNTGCTGNGPNGWAVRRGPGASASTVVCTAPAQASGGVAGQLVYTANADDYVDGRWMIGADGLSATAGRWNITRANSSLITWGDRRLPAVPNGFSYVPVGFPTIGAGVSGTTAASDPGMPTEEGGMVLDGGVLWQAQRIPLPGDLIYGEVECETSALTGNAGPEMRLIYTDTSSTTISTYANFHTGDATRGNYEAIAHGRIVLRTKQPLVVPAVAPLQIYMEVKNVGRSSSALTNLVKRVRIGNATREALA